MSAKALIGIVISTILLLVLIFSVDWAGVWVALQAMKLWPLLPATFVFLLQYVARALRWRLLLAEGQRASTRQLFDSILVGCLGNFLLPLRAGEFIRPFLLSHYTQISFSTSLVSVVVERFFDLAMVLGLFGLVTILTPGIPAEVNIGAAALSSLAIAIFLIILLGSFMEARLLSILDFMLRPLPEKIRLPLRAFAKDFLDGASVLRTPTRVLLVIAYTAGIWILIVALYWIFFWLFEIDASFEAALATTVITALAVAAPSAPGFIGVYQWACVASFALFAFSAEKGVAYSIITHLYHFLAYVILGGYVLWRDGLKLSDLNKRKESL